MAFTADQIAQATGAPLVNVAANWPTVLAALRWQHCADRLTQVAMIGTIIVETGITVNGVNQTFKPVAELGGQNAWYAPWFGRGYIQCTLESNYASYGPRLDPPLNLLANPDLMLQPTPSAQFAALYFVDRGIPAMADAQNWTAVREAVNGGLTGWTIYYPAVESMLAMTYPPDVPPVTTVSVACVLKQEPNHTCPAAIGPDHKPVHLAIGMVVHFTGRTTPHWAEVTLDNSPVHGWLLRSDLRTI